MTSNHFEPSTGPHRLVGGWRRSVLPSPGSWPHAGRPPLVNPQRAVATGTRPQTFRGAFEEATARFIGARLAKGPARVTSPQPGPEP